MKKKWLNKLFWLTIIAGIVSIGAGACIELLLSSEPLLKTEVKLVVEIFTAIIVFIFFEWAIFRIYIWQDFSKYVVEKLTLSETIFKIFNEYSDAKLLYGRFLTTIKSDLELESALTSNTKTKSLYISTLKYKDFLESHFISDGESKIIQQIPTYFFKKKIWKEFIENSSHYYSLQILDDELSTEYINDKDRLESELNFLFTKRSGKNRTKIKKLFVVMPDQIENGKLIDGEIKNYIKFWKTKLDNSTNTFPIKIIKKDDAIGVIDTGDNLSDIGIFGDVYGIQSKNLQTNKFHVDNLKIDFYFDSADARLKKEAFNKLFKISTDIGNAF